MAVYTRDSAGKRVFNFIVGFFVLSFGLNEIESGDPGLGLAAAAFGGLAMFITVFFNPWTRKR